MSGSTITKASLAQRIRDLIAGTQKHSPNGSLTFGGQSFTEQSLVQALQSLADALAKVDAARANWQEALKHLTDVKATVVPLVGSYVSWIKATYGSAPATLGDYGLAPRKARTPLTAEQLVLADAGGRPRAPQGTRWVRSRRRESAAPLRRRR
jgi:hypothetical protein